MSLTLKRVDVVVLFVGDLDRARAFYRDILGLQLLFEDQDAAAFGFENMMLHVLSIGGAQDLLSTEAVPVQRPIGATSQLVVFVENVDATHTELVAKGVEFVRQPIDREWGMRTAHFKDPDGNIWELAQSLSTDSTQS